MNNPASVSPLSENRNFPLIRGLCSHVQGKDSWPVTVLKVVGIAIVFFFVVVADLAYMSWSALFGKREVRVGDRTPVAPREEASRLDNLDDAVKKSREPAAQHQGVPRPLKSLAVPPSFPPSGGPRAVTTVLAASPLASPVDISRKVEAFKKDPTQLLSIVKTCTEAEAEAFGASVAENFPLSESDETIGSHQALYKAIGEVIQWSNSYLYCDQFANGFLNCEGWTHRIEQAQVSYELLTNMEHSRISWHVSSHNLFLGAIERGKKLALDRICEDSSTRTRYRNELLGKLATHVGPFYSLFSDPVYVSFWNEQAIADACIQICRGPHKITLLSLIKDLQQQRNLFQNVLGLIPQNSDLFAQMNPQERRALLIRLPDEIVDGLRENCSKLKDSHPNLQVPSLVRGRDMVSYLSPERVSETILKMTSHQLLWIDPDESVLCEYVERVDPLNFISLLLIADVRIMSPIESVYHLPPAPDACITDRVQRLLAARIVELEQQERNSLMEVIKSEEEQPLWFRGVMEYCSLMLAMADGTLLDRKTWNAIESSRKLGNGQKAVVLYEKILKAPGTLLDCLMGCLDTLSQNQQVPNSPGSNSNVFGILTELCGGHRFLDSEVQRFDCEWNPIVAQLKHQHCTLCIETLLNIVKVWQKEPRAEWVISPSGKWGDHQDIAKDSPANILERGFKSQRRKLPSLVTLLQQKIEREGKAVAAAAAPSPATATLTSVAPTPNNRNTVIVAGAPTATPPVPAPSAASQASSASSSNTTASVPSAKSKK
jgi:DNA-binding protein Fis